MCFLSGPNQTLRAWQLEHPLSSHPSSQIPGPRSNSLTALYQTSLILTVPPCPNSLPSAIVFALCQGLQPRTGLWKAKSQEDS